MVYSRLCDTAKLASSAPGASPIDETPYKHFILFFFFFLTYNTHQLFGKKKKNLRSLPNHKCTALDGSTDSLEEEEGWCRESRGRQAGQRLRCRGLPLSPPRWEPAGEGGSSTAPSCISKSSAISQTLHLLLESSRKNLKGRRVLVLNLLPFSRWWRFVFPAHTAVCVFTARAFTTGED